MDSRILPPDLPNCKLNDYDYEQGFDESLLLNSEYADCFSCPICHGIPRNPVLIKPCNHFFCECCVEKQQAAVNADYHERSGWLQCAVCKTEFHPSNSIPFEKFIPALKKVYHLMRLRCPNGCNFIGDPQEMDKHQSFQCDIREVTCPSLGCQRTMPFHQLRDKHVAVCSRLMIYCQSCLLPVKREQLPGHNCKDRMALAIKGICSNIHYIFSILIRSLTSSKEYADE